MPNVATPVFQTWVDQLTSFAAKCKDIENFLQTLDSKAQSSNDYFRQGLERLKRNDFSLIIKETTDEIDDIKKMPDVWNSYNEQYQTYIINRLQSILVLANSIASFSLSETANFALLADNFMSLEALLTRDSKFHLFEHFKFGDKNYVLFGKNGAGKTTLLNNISQQFFNTNSVVIPATRGTNYFDSYSSGPGEENLITAINCNQDGKAMFLLARCIISREMEQRRKGVSGADIISDKAIAIFSSLGIDRTLIIDTNGRLFLNSPDGTQYSLQAASDGEKSAVFLIFAVLLSPINAYIFIDEPENHLNGALMRKLFGALEGARPDAKFVFATHNVPFIESCKNKELVYLEKTGKPNEWNFKLFKDYSELPLDVVLNIEGTNDNVIFCEGEDKNSYDCKLYEALFQNYQIMPAHGCENVVSQTENLNKYSTIFKKRGYGIVDNDFRDNIDIGSLNLRKITVLPVNEIEDLFLEECCLVSMNSFLHLTISKEDIESEIITRIDSMKDEIIQDFATKLLRRLQMNNKFRNSGGIENSLNVLLQENKAMFLRKYSDFVTKLSDSVSKKQYGELLKIVPGKMLINEAAAIFGFHDGTVYKDRLLFLINHDGGLKKSLKELIHLVE